MSSKLLTIRGTLLKGKRCASQNMYIKYLQTLVWLVLSMEVATKNPFQATSKTNQGKTKVGRHSSLENTTPRHTHL